MTKKRISSRLTISILTTSFIIITVIVYLNYDFSKRILMQRIEENAISKSNLIINGISRHVVSAQEITRNVANQSLYYLKNNDLQFFLENVLRSNKILNAIHVDFDQNFIKSQNFTSYYLNGSINNSNSGNTCVLDQFSDFYTNFKSSESGFWTDPYLCVRPDSNIVISYSYPIINPSTKEKVGFVSSEIRMDYINQVVSNIKIGEEGISFIINKSGLFLAHPKKEWVLKKNLFDLSDNVLPDNMNEIREKINNRGSISGFANPELYDFRKAWFYLSPMPFSDWTVITLIPEKELYQDLNVVFEEIIIVSIIGLIFIVFFFVVILRRTLNPLEQVTEAIQKFSFGTLKTIDLKNEVASLENSLENLQARYDKYDQERDKNKRDKKKFDKDMKSAKEIQFNIIPTEYPAFPKREEIDIYAMLKPAQIIGGDLFDYFFIDTNHLLFTIGDVSGKGIPASLFMAVAHTLVKSHSNVLSTKHIVEKLNNDLSVRNSNQHFITMFLGILDVENGILDYCNAAHNYPYIKTANGVIKQLEDTHGLPVGLYPNKAYKNSTIVLKSGESIILYTDGVIDCRNDKDETYGAERFETVLKELKDISSYESVFHLDDDIMKFKGDTDQVDDISIMSLKFIKKKPESN